VFFFSLGFSTSLYQFRPLAKRVRFQKMAEVLNDGFIGMIIRQPKSSNTAH